MASLGHYKLECQRCKGSMVATRESDRVLECRDCGQRTTLATGVKCTCFTINPPKVCPMHGYRVKAVEL